MPFDLLHFGSGTLAFHYFIFCYVSIIGTIVAVSARYQRADLGWLQGPAAYWLGAILVVAGTIWFLLVEEELFIPGLAGGELFTIFAGGFIAAHWTIRITNILFTRARLFLGSNITQKEEPLP